MKQMGSGGLFLQQHRATVLGRTNTPIDDDAFHPDGIDRHVTYQDQLAAAFTSLGTPSMDKWLETGLLADLDKIFARTIEHPQQMGTASPTALAEMEAYKVAVLESIQEHWLEELAAEKNIYVARIRNSARVLQPTKSFMWIDSIQFPVMTFLARVAWHLTFKRGQKTASFPILTTKVFLAMHENLSMVDRAITEVRVNFSFFSTVCICGIGTTSRQYHGIHIENSSSVQLSGP